MKFFIITLCLIVAVAADFSDEEHQKWKSFKVKHGKMFMSKNKEVQRMRNFLVNCDHVESVNERFANGDILHSACEYPHHDLSKEEFVARFCGAKEENATDVRMLPVMRQTPPASLDLTLTAEVGAVKNQGQCGSCWTFSTTASTESRSWRNTKSPIILSEQQLVDCVYTRSGCDGGWMSTAFDWVKANGQTTGANLPYKGTYSGKCTTPSKAFVAKGWAQAAADVNSIKNSLNANGVLAIAVDATNWGSYQTGLFTAASMGQVNHAVNLVGYGTCTQTGLAFWKIRNSWGTGWGEKGYIRVPITPTGGRSNTYSIGATFAVL